MKKFLIAATMFLATSVFGQCAPEPELFKAMVSERKESPVLILNTQQSTGPRHFVIFANQEKSTWTIVGTDRKKACIMAEGQGVTLVDDSKEEKPGS